eukprot:CAMPEP_0184490666 /NCGR_PEP_ID=MMETSP0113_2-20130426/18508_1 /TAXON_ID=91329 /ORGANISM="Norrisiella sphaerica, Strain BC52" /LENGTH=939 /DNA_ID=CAMNT_0026874659 /DNA_START=713 /DNA_END=3529 /DNA_ORIENTATION=-
MPKVLGIDLFSLSLPDQPLSNLDELAARIQNLQRSLRILTLHIGKSKGFEMDIPIEDNTAIPIQFHSLQQGGEVFMGPTGSKDAPDKPFFDLGGNTMIYPEVSDSHNIIFGVDTSKGGSKYQDKSQLALDLGELRVEKWMACARQKLWWMTPSVGTKHDKIPAETQFLLGEIPSEDGNGETRYVLMLPLVDQTFRTALYSSSNRKIQIRLESGDPMLTAKRVPAAFYVAAGSDPYALVERGMKYVSDYLGTFQCRQDKKIPKIADMFGWCTWDAFYSKVNRRGISKGLEVFSRNHTPAKYLILDDGWQEAANDDKWRTGAEEDVRDDVDVADMEGGGALGAENWGEKKSERSIFALLVKLLTWLYENKVERSKFGSWSVRLWRWLASGLMRESILNYFAEATDWMKRLVDVKANRKFDPLHDFVSELKEKNSLEYVYCWHALLGYWLGVDPSSSEMSEFEASILFPYSRGGYRPNILSVEPSLAWSPPTFVGVGMVNRHQATKFYRKLHSYLRSCGIDGVKVDVQAAATTLGTGLGGGAGITRKMVSAMEKVASEQLDSNVIGCMAHPTENLFSFSLTPIIRASDDFYPNNPKTHQQHITTNAFNSMFLGSIAVPDWDCFHTRHEFADLHATARAVGGCPVYVSDKVDEVNHELLRRLVLPDGSVYRALFPGRPTRDSLFNDTIRDGFSALKVWNMNPVVGVIGAFNVQGWGWDRERYEYRDNFAKEGGPPNVTTRLRPSDVEGFREIVAGARARGEIEPGLEGQGTGYTGEFVLFSQKEGKYKVVADDADGLDISLRPNDASVVFVAPVMQMESHRNDLAAEEGAKVTFAPIGATDMYNGGGAVQKVERMEDERLDANSVAGVAMEVTAVGNFAVYVGEAAPRVVRVRKSGEDLDHYETFDFAFKKLNDAKGGIVEISLPETGSENEKVTPLRLELVW